MSELKAEPKSESKPRSIRIDDATLKKFKEISENLNGNQQLTLATLIDVYELQQGTLTAPECAENIEQFQKYMQAMTRLYTTALENSANVQALCRAEFAAQLTSKESIIVGLQQKLEKALAAASRVSQLEAELSAAAENSRRLQEQLADRKLLNEQFQQQLGRLQSEVDDVHQNTKQAVTQALAVKELEYSQKNLELLRKLEDEKQMLADKYQSKIFELMKDR